MGPFGDEWIAGSYLKNFSFFSFFYIFKTFKNKNFNTLLLITMITLHLTAILLSGNKMPLFLFFFGCVLIILLIKNFRFVMSVSLLIFVSIFFLLVNYDSHENTNYYEASYKRFFSEINIMKFIEINKDTSIKKDPTKTVLNENYEDTNINIPKKIILLRDSEYNRVFRTAIKMWKERPFTGFGLKSFRFKCWDMLAKDNIERKISKRPQMIVCANHAHNYYLELLSEAGIIGASLVVIFFFILLKDSLFFLKKHNRQINSEVSLLAPIIILFFLEIWPIKSTGSFFTTWGATFFWINVGLLISGISKKT
jgi:O-antigen ligase